MISVADLKTALRVTHANDDTYIGELEERAVAYVEQKTGRYFGDSGESTEYVRGDDTDTLWLGESASAVSSVTEQAYPGADTTVIAEADDDGFVIRGGKLIRKGGNVWSSGMEYVVVYTRGYAAGTEPADIRQAVEGLVVLWYSIRLPVALGTVGPAVPNHVSAILAAHRRPRV